MAIESDLTYMLLHIPVAPATCTPTMLFRLFIHPALALKPPTNEVELQIKQPPFILENSTKSVDVHEGEDVQIECHAGGSPPPTIFWRRAYNAILPTGAATYHGNILVIKNITKEQRGTYFCIADNGVGRANRRVIAVNVKFAPILTVEEPRQGQALGHNISLTCRVEAYPPPALTWFKDDVALWNKEHYSISNFQTDDDIFFTNLQVTGVKKQHYGFYICRAANEMGTAETKVELFETTDPV